MVSDDDIQALADDIAAKFDVERIILFGSHAYGTPHEWSDVDLAVLTNDELLLRDGSLNAIQRIRRAIKRRFATDLLLYDSAGFWRRYREFDPIPRMAVDHGRTLYERNGEGVVRQGRGRLAHGQT